MDLWIRSQDKTVLTKDCNLVIEEYLSDFVDVRTYTHDGCSIKLGEYKTKKRALEILDEIQNMIKPTLITTEYHSEIKQDIDKLSFDVIMQPDEDKITYIQPDVIIYEMPEK